MDLPQGPVEGSVIGPDELPPPYEKTGGIPMVACRVCQVAFAVKYQVFKDNFLGNDRHLGQEGPARGQV